MLQPLYLLDPLYANSVFHLQLITSIYYILSFSSCNNLVKVRLQIHAEYTAHSVYSTVVLVGVASNYQLLHAELQAVEHRDQQ